MDTAWGVLACFVSFAFGAILGLAFAQDVHKKSARAGIMVIDGTAYVMIPAKRGE